jgi:hypothetical protein
LLYQRETRDIITGLHVYEDEAAALKKLQPHAPSQHLRYHLKLAVRRSPPPTQGMRVTTRVSAWHVSNNSCIVLCTMRLHTCTSTTPHYLHAHTHTQLADGIPSGIVLAPKRCLPGPKLTRSCGANDTHACATPAASQHLPTLLGWSNCIAWTPIDQHQPPLRQGKQGACQHWTLVRSNHPSTTWSEGCRCCCWGVGG